MGTQRERRSEELKRRRDLKAQLIEENGLICMSCGASEGWPPISLSHIIALSRGGKTTEENCLLECYPCHEKYEKRPELREKLKELR